MPCLAAYSIAASRVMFRSRCGARIFRSGAMPLHREVEAHLVVALAGGAVGHRGRAVLARRRDQVLGDQRAARARR